MDNDVLDYLKTNEVYARKKTLKNWIWLFLLLTVFLFNWIFLIILVLLIIYYFTRQTYSLIQLKGDKVYKVSATKQAWEEYASALKIPSRMQWNIMDIKKLVKSKNGTRSNEIISPKKISKKKPVSDETKPLEKPTKLRDIEPLPTLNPAFKTSELIKQIKKPITTPLSDQVNEDTFYFKVVGTSFYSLKQSLAYAKKQALLTVVLPSHYYLVEKSLKNRFHFSSDLNKFLGKIELVEDTESKLDKNAIKVNLKVNSKRFFIGFMPKDFQQVIDLYR